MLQQSIQDLYKVFSAYKLNTKIQGCYCNVCLDEEYNKYLHDKKLTELNEEDFTGYLSCIDILNPESDNRDFKYFLPRMLELCAISYGFENIYLKIAESDYKNWPTVETEAVNTFFRDFWDDQLKTKSALAIIFLLYDLADAEYNIEPCLKNLSDLKPEELTELLINLYDNNAYLKDPSKYINPYHAMIKDWFISPKNIDLLTDYFKSGKDPYGRTTFSIPSS